MTNHNQHPSPKSPLPETLDTFLDRHDLPKEQITSDKVANDVAINALVSRLSQEEARAERAGIDFKTSCLNETGFNEFLRQRDNLGRRAGDVLPNGTLVLAVDMDKLKETNDTFGHGTGNIAIKAVADGIKAALRDGDVVARIGGDEFVAVVDIYADDPDEVQERILAKAQESLAHLDVELPGSTFEVVDNGHGPYVSGPTGKKKLDISASVGGQYIDGVAGSAKIRQAVDEADAKMYERKRAAGVARS